MGVIMGSASYMAPEQAKGRTVDKRADIWAFGAVLYEMLTGKRAFVGEDVSDTLAAVLRAEVDLGVMPGDTPPRLRQVLRACLRRDLKERVHDMADVRLAMKGVFETPAEALAEQVVAPTLRVWQQPVPLVLGVVALVAIGGGAVWSLQAPPSPRPLARFAITPPALGNTPSGPDLTISPDGSHIVNRAGGRNGLVIRALAELEARQQPELGRVFSPFISPDGVSIGFHSPGSLERVSVFGGPSLTICTLPPGFYGVGASWGPDDTIIFGTTQPGGLKQVSAGGGEPEELTTPNTELGEVSHEWPDILPGGRAVLFTIVPAGPIENAQIAVLDLETGVQKILVPGGSYPRYSPTGHIVYGVSGTLRAVGFNLERLEVTTNPLPVLDGVITKNTGAANFSFSRDGTLVYVPGTGVGGSSPQRTLVWVDRDGREEPLDLPAGGYNWPRVSHDGTRVAVEMDGDVNDVWTSDVARGTLSLLTPDPAADFAPLWTSDGERIVFNSDRERGGCSGRRPTGGARPSRCWRVRTRTSPGVFPYDWSPDGNELLINYVGPDGNFDIGILSMEGQRSWRPLLNSAAGEG